MTVYFWKDDAVVELAHRGSAQTVPFDLWDCLCVDTYHQEADMRYGEFGKTGWEFRFLGTFPAEFRAHLLLLGVT